jgi:hypothetical protein
MDIPPGTPSLLLTLLKGLKSNASKVSPKYISHYDPNAAVVQKNVDDIVDAIEDPQPNLIKDIAQRKLYEVLYEIIEKQYEEPEHEPETPEGLAKAQAARDLSRTLNSAIGRALENAISGELKDLPTIQALREELREKIIQALAPKRPM